MEDKHDLGETLNAFLAGKGFYIVLLLCLSLIAGSVWLMTSGSGTVQEASETAAESVPAGAVAAMKTETVTLPTATPLPPNVPVMAEIAAPTAEPELNMPEVEVTETAEIQYGLTDYFIWPVNGAVDRGYSVETLSYDATMADWRVHSALDIAASEGAQVLSCANGTVTAVYPDGALGTVVEIDHGEGLRGIYANLAAETAVYPGAEVRVGDPIGTVGHTASIESGAAPHLHFAMERNGESVDPTEILPEQ